MRFASWWLAVVLAACGPAATPAKNGPGRSSGPPLAPKRLELERVTPRSSNEPAPLVAILHGEIERTLTSLRSAGAPVPYFLSYQVIDESTVEVAAELGALVTSAERRARSLDVDVRFGSHEFDNRREIRGEWDESRLYSLSAWLPLEDDARALAPLLWLTTHRELQRAEEEFVRVQADREVKVDGASAADFSREAPVRHFDPVATLELDRSAWEARARRLSARFAQKRGVLRSGISVGISAETRTSASSEGASLQLAATHARLVVSAAGVADDGMHLSRDVVLYARTAAGLPSEEAVAEVVDRVAADVAALREAPLVDPFTGPAILDGPAAGVFFHEVFGHRMEGHRQKSESEGQTFAAQVGKAVMPAFLDVYDDPTIARVGGLDLDGFYLFDDEGVRADRASLVVGGVLQGFLMSRSPLDGFDRSNGHGRRERGHRVVSRQGNLVVDPRVTTTRAALKQLLLDEIRRQGKPYGLRFSDITGGFTMTTRSDPQAFKVLPVMVYRVHPDGREELVRGVDIEGTPLTALSRILAAANDFDVFNGMCGGESGWVPVSAVSPSLLVSQIEVARREKELDRPPLLPPPGPHRGGDASAREAR